MSETGRGRGSICVIFVEGGKIQEKAKRLGGSKSKRGSRRSPKVGILRSKGKVGERYDSTLERGTILEIEG